MALNPVSHSRVLTPSFEGAKTTAHRLQQLFATSCFVETTSQSLQGRTHPLHTQLEADFKAIKTLEEALAANAAPDTLCTLYRGLPSFAKEVLCYLIWVDHGHVQTHNYGEEAILSDPSLLKKETFPYLHGTVSSSLISQMSASMQERIALVKQKRCVDQLEYLKSMIQEGKPNHELKSALQSLPEEIQWFFHGKIYELSPDKQKTPFWGRNALEADVSRLMRIGTPNLLEEAISAHKRTYTQALDMQKQTEKDRFTFLVDSDKLTHRELHKLYKGLDPAIRTALPEQYQPPYYGRGIRSDLYKEFGSRIDGDHVVFSTYAPNAESVSVAIRQDGADIHVVPMESKGAGKWEVRTPLAEAGSTYQYLMRQKDTGSVYRKTDPFARYNLEKRETDYGSRFTHESVVVDESFTWSDEDWIKQRVDSTEHVDHLPRNIYELHVSGWIHRYGHFPSWETLAKELAEHCKAMGFTHVELMGVLNHTSPEPFACYQPSAFFATNYLLGNPQEFKAFINYMHEKGIGVIIDWVPGHFGNDEFGLHQYDGSFLYEHPDYRRSINPNWGVFCFNYEEKRVRDFLLSSARYFVEECHVDGLRVDGVTSMLFTDFDRRESLPHHKGGGWHIDAMHFLRDLTTHLHEKNPGVILSAEESTGAVGSTFPIKEKPITVSYPSGQKAIRGLGFDEKWTIGWTNHILEFLKKSPEGRLDRRELFTALKVDTSALNPGYTVQEKVTRGPSHDECAGGKGSLLYHMRAKDPAMQTLPDGDRQVRQFQDLRLLYANQMCLPGSKLTFSGNEFGQTEEWSHRMIRELPGVDWDVMACLPHEQYKSFVRAWNAFYQNHPALWGKDESSMQWFHTADTRGDEGRPLIAFLRKAPSETLVCIQNFGDTEENDYLIDLPEDLANVTSLTEIMNTQQADGTQTPVNGSIEIIRDATGSAKQCKLKIPAGTALVLEVKKESV